ncbi:CBS domain-containing protein [Geodermatophilus ruber]|uniref:CBS domain-containing protein n=1 Tax=Geodermatophilus ruber TaxID=504800 RepID=A0A1I4E247_9ACTN|nr:CBS domain-containing protein [Geodermatophilus ruber]SFK99832.1 CBS domain-containing protein [Geodermatophilus ruber]
MQARDVMTREVVTVGPETSAKYAAEVMAEHGFAALPVVDDGDRLVGIVAEADVLRDRMPPDPRLHLRRDGGIPTSAPSLLVHGVMTREVRSVQDTADIADVARLFVDDRLRSVPVVDGDRLVGIVSRRDLLRTLVRPDAEIRHDLLRLVEGYTGSLDSWAVSVADGVATIQRTRGVPEPSPAVEEQALSELARTVGGVVHVRVLPAQDRETPVTGQPSHPASTPR